MSYSGSCHCGAVTFVVEGDVPGKATSCNCSHCRRKGFLLTFAPSEALTVESGAENLAEYRFATHKIAHRFCRTCGCEPFGQGVGPGGKDMAAINLRCVPDLDLDSLEIVHHDGASS